MVKTQESKSLAYEQLDYFKKQEGVTNYLIIMIIEMILCTAFLLFVLYQITQTEKSK